MVIENLKEYNNALIIVRDWLQKGVFTFDTYKEIEGWIEAIESYTGMPLPAKHYIINNISRKRLD